MLVRMVIVCLILVAFAAGFSELVEQAALAPAAERTAFDCAQWSGPDCNPLLYR